MLRITVVTDTDGTVVRMSGRLAGDQLEEARRVCFTDKPHLLIGLSKYLSMRVSSLREGRSGGDDRFGPSK